MRKFVDITGQKFGRLTALELSSIASNGDYKWKCACDCGNLVTPRYNNLNRGLSQSCGCIAKELNSKRLSIDLVGKVFGKFTVIGRVGSRNGEVLWKARCDCGQIENRTISRLKTERAMCSNCKKIQTSEVRTIDLIGRRFGRLEVLERITPVGDGRIKWLCRCDCGNVVGVCGSNLQTSTTASCGCLRIEITKNRSTTHGDKGSKEYASWSNMLTRCYNPNSTQYKWYGGRGIKVCDRWRNSYENFLEDMGRCPEGLTLDRIGVNGNYSSENCRWASWEVQANNKQVHVKAAIRNELPYSE